MLTVVTVHRMMTVAVTVYYKKKVAMEHHMLEKEKFSKKMFHMKRIDFVKVLHKKMMVVLHMKMTVELHMKTMVGLHMMMMVVPHMKWNV